MKFLTDLRQLRPLAAMCLLITAGLALGQNIESNPQAKTEVLDKVSDLLTVHAYVPGLDFSKWPGFIAGEKAKIDASTNDDEFGQAVNEALTKFGASHIYLATPRAVDARRNASIVGIGVSQVSTPDGALIIRVVAGAPADEAGLVAGDIITKVNGEKAEGPKGIAGKEGTDVTITVKHANGKVQDYTLTRHKFSTVRPEEFAIVDKDTAKVTIHTFDFTYNRDNVESIMRKALPYKNLILDLRDNGGGAVVNLQHLLGMLLPSDSPVGTFVNKPMVNAYIKATGNTPDVTKIADWSRHRDEFEFQQIRPLRNRDVPIYKGNIAVLINGFSGSASEILGAALHDLKGSSLVGSKSAGAVLVSVIGDATNHFNLQYPIMDYVTIRGVRLEGSGLNPEVSVNEPKYRLPGTPDEAVEKAEALFARAKLRDERGLGVQ